ncbi:hypothetical protein [Peptacetobacter hiranonis]|uniref:Uncharacterized protein n=2 Tax=Peptacetobacter TaxID=2743582 RepID=B6G0S5_PEPHT|nr:hypothetical protein [Peptacetobacter hiranonis]EEA84651.1 hypothetical protein CLOHIR_01731 [Peptacetobacter hiranonis DSM 13275]QEK21678.1 hypothetical protein KGNDJEFE_02172 [Peptacetobacter hiranonis]
MINREINIIDYKLFSETLCNRLHHLLQMGQDNNFEFVELELVIYALKDLINDIKDISSIKIIEELTYPQDYIKFYEKELEEKKDSIMNLEFEIEYLKNYYN